MPRVPYVFPEPGASEVADSIRERRGGELLELDGVMLHAPALALGWNAIGQGVRLENSLHASIREMIMLRVAALNGATYEWNQHEPLARHAGLTSAHLAAIRDTSALDTRGVLSAELRACMAYTDAMTRDVRVPQAVFDALKELLSDRQVVEVTMTVAAYNMVSRVLVALDVGDVAEEPVPMPEGFEDC